MQWHNKLRLGVLAGFSLLVLVGCGSDDINGQAQEAAPLGGETTIEELGLRLAPDGLDLDGLTQEGIDQVARGSYLVNGVAICISCHTGPAGYLAGGVQFPLPFGLVFSRNLTPDPVTGLQLTEAEFIEVIRTGKDFTDSTAGDPQRLIIMPWHVFRFMSLDNIKAIFAFLRRIPAVNNDVQKTFKPDFPFPPVTFPPIGDGDPVNDPNNAERGLVIPQHFSSAANDPNFDHFVSQFNATVADLAPEERAKVGRGSYLVNALAPCNDCHTDDDDDGQFDGGLIPFTVDVSTAAYLAGGVDLGAFFGAGSIFSRNLTPHDTTGLLLTEDQFIQVLRFGADFRRPGGSLRVPPHFPAEFHMVLDDLKAVHAYLRAIPAVEKAVEIVP